MARVVGESWKKNMNDWWKLTAAVEFFFRIRDDPVYPFEEIGLGYYRLRYQNHSPWIGFWFWFLCFFMLLACAFHLGWAGMILGPCLILFPLGLKKLYLKLNVKEIIFCKTAGFIIRQRWRSTPSVEQKIYNIYIRLGRVVDFNQTWNFYLELGGCELESIRLTRNELEEKHLRFLGRVWARNMNLNYFDYDDVSEAHRVIHYRNTSPYEHLQEVSVQQILDEMRLRRGDRLTRHLREWLSSARYTEMIERITEKQMAEEELQVEYKKYLREVTDVKEILWEQWVQDLMDEYHKFRMEMKLEDEKVTEEERMQIVRYAQDYDYQEEGEDMYA